MRAAFYEKDVTPPLGGYLAGYYKNYCATDVLDTLHVRAGVFEDEGSVAAIVSIDSCEVPDDLHDAVTKRITEYTGIPAGSVILSCNHTHKGMPIYDSPEINAFADGPYKDVAYRLIADCVTLAYKRLNDCSVSFFEGCVEGISFNRNYVRNDGVIVTFNGPDRVRPFAGIDPALPVIFARDAQGKPMGAIVSFACHQDTVRGDNYSGQFSHVMSDDLKREFGEDFVTVFVPGACGDINHLPNEYGKKVPRDIYLTMGHALSKGFMEAMKNETPMKGGVACKKELLTVRRRILDTESYYREIEEFAKEKRGFSIRNLAYYQEQVTDPETKVWVGAARIGDAAVFAFPGEIYVNYGLDVKKRSPFKNNLVATLCNTGCGYIATKDCFGPNSRVYETALCFGACLDENAGSEICDKLIGLADLLKNSGT